jgi:tetratricopeptide (TPR) repeat protein
MSIIQEMLLVMKNLMQPISNKSDANAVIAGIQRLFSTSHSFGIALMLMLLFSARSDQHQFYGRQVHEVNYGHGVVNFPISCNETARAEFEQGLERLHHMMYSKAQSRFEAAAEADPGCAMAHWGIAMTSFQPLWAPTSDDDMARGIVAVQNARALGAPTDRERAFISTVAAFFNDPDPPADNRPGDHQKRLRAWMEASRELHEAMPDDVDAAAFYALSEISYAMTYFSPHQERDYTREKRAGALMERFLEDYPEHPGLFHYLIHAYDSSHLAHMAEDVARKYDQLAPDTPHALHMPSHIFVRLGYWEDTADWNERSADAALRNPYRGITSLHYPHALDYMMYAYLQLEEYEKARKTLEKVRAIEEGQPHFATAYGIAAAQARYYLEQQKWEEAAELSVYEPGAVNWDNYPAAKSIFYYARGLGAARSGDLDQAEEERDKIREAVQEMRNAGDIYWSYMTEALSIATDAWILYESGQTESALELINEAAELEESMDKHPITPGEVLPVRELQAEMLYLESRYEEAQNAFEASIERTPNRRNALKGLEKIVAAL